MKSKKRYFILSFMGENQDKSLAFASYDLVIDDFPSHKQIMDGINKRNPNITKTTLLSLNEYSKSDFEKFVSEVS